MPSDVLSDVLRMYISLVRDIVDRIAIRLPIYVDLDELENHGARELEEAAREYDPGRDCGFKAYAERRIRGAILKQLRDHEGLSCSAQKALHSAGETVARIDPRGVGRLESRRGRVASAGDVSASLGLRRDKFRELARRIDGGIEPAGAGESLVTHIEGSGRGAPGIERVRNSRAMTDAMAALPASVRLAFRFYYFERLNVREIGEVLGVGASEVNEMLSQAASCMRAILNDCRWVERA